MMMMRNKYYIYIEKKKNFVNVMNLNVAITLINVTNAQPRWYNSLYFS